MTLLTQENIKRLFRYTPETGEFFGLSSGNKEPVGSLSHAGYVMISIRSAEEGGKTKRYCAHRLAWLYVYGSLPEFQIDHINGDRADNRIDNLRQATIKQNGGNRKGSSNSTIGVKGVSQYGHKFRARIMVSKKLIWLGTFETKDEAAHAYNKAAIQHFGDFACLNPIGTDK